MFRSHLRPLFEADKGDPTGGTGGSPAPAAASAGDPMAAFQNLLNRSSDAAALARQLFDENYRYRDRVRELERQVPAQGAVILSADEAALWQSYKQLGAPADVQKVITEGKTLKRDLELRDVASAAGYSVDVLRTLAGELAFEVRDEQKDNKPVKAVYVKVDGKDIPAETYAAQQWAAFLPALKPAQQSQAGAPAVGATNPAGSRGQTPPPAFDPQNPPRLSSIQWKT
jgi:hypothetical protein